MMNKDVLGQALYDARQVFQDKSVDQLIEEYGSLNNARLAMCKVDADVIINHIKTTALLTIPGTGLAAGSQAVTGQSTTGTIQ